jgi:dTDP-4-dehydrorhamnose reductase
MTILLIGADGQLGSDLRVLLADDRIVPLFYPAFDITCPDDIRGVLAAAHPDLVINTAAFHRVDECEDRVEEAFRVNAFAVRDLALACQEAGAALVHFSTDYVFDGRKNGPYVEEDAPGPLNAYAASKLAGEYFVRAACERHFIVRTSGLFGLAGPKDKGRNFIDTMLELADQGRLIRVVNDQRVTPTSTEELAARVNDLIRTTGYGLFHLTNEGSCTWYELARAVFDLTGTRADLRPVDTASFGAKARRPAYSVLENKRAREAGLAEFSPWTVALKTYLRKKGRI